MDIPRTLIDWLIYPREIQNWLILQEKGHCIVVFHFKDYHYFVKIPLRFEICHSPSPPSNLFFTLFWNDSPPLIFQTFQQQVWTLLLRYNFFIFTWNFKEKEIVLFAKLINDSCAGQRLFNLIKRVFRAAMSHAKLHPKFAKSRPRSSLSHILKCNKNENVLKIPIIFKCLAPK